MSDPNTNHPDLARSRLRTAVAAVEAEMSQSPAPLAKSWADLVTLMALGPEPDVRECPVCKHVGMRAATVCGYCWHKLTPPAPTEAGP